MATHEEITAAFQSYWSNPMIPERERWERALEAAEQVREQAARDNRRRMSIEANNRLDHQEWTHPLIREDRPE